MIDPKIKLITLIGPTASGKTDLALQLAEEFEGEIICADSRTIYRGMDVGTAKPTRQDQARVKHHLLDVVEPDEAYSAQNFKQAAEVVVGEVFSRGKTPFLVGGTGLYVYSVVYDFLFPAGPRTAERAELEHLPLAELVGRLQREDPMRAQEIDLKNPRRVIRALETVGQPRQKQTTLPPNILLIGLLPDLEVLNKRITQRTQAMFQIGLVPEVRQLIKIYGADIEVLKSPGYAEVVDYLAGRTSLGEAQDLVDLHTRQLVKRQLTWFRRNHEIVWVSEPGQAKIAVRKFLA